MSRPLPHPPARRRSAGRHWIIAAFAMLLPLAIHAQTIGRLIGNVTDDNERPLQGASVKVLGASPAREITINKADGSYALTGMRPGDYEIEFRARGYEAQRKSVRIAADRTSILNARLILEQPESVVGVPRNIESPSVRKGEEKKVANIGTSGSDIPTRPSVAEPSRSEPPPAAESSVATPSAEVPGSGMAAVELPAAGASGAGLPRSAGDTLSSRGSGGMLVNVIDEEGKPLGGARLFLGDARRSLPALSDGSIGVEHLLPGDYEVTLTAKGRRAEKRSVRIAPNHVVTLIVKLAPAE